jgi:hypothetical protein
MCIASCVQGTMYSEVDRERERERGMYTKQWETPGFESGLRCSL